MPLHVGEHPTERYDHAAPTVRSNHLLLGLLGFPVGLKFLDHLPGQIRKRGQDRIVVGEKRKERLGRAFAEPRCQLSRYLPGLENTV